VRRRRERGRWGEADPTRRHLLTSSLSFPLLSDSLRAIVLAGIAGLVAGALSMAVGEYISMSSQR